MGMERKKSRPRKTEIKREIEKKRSDSGMKNRNMKEHKSENRRTKEVIQT